jgi:F420-0:gamma-glutamyl ligase
MYNNLQEITFDKEYKYLKEFVEKYKNRNVNIIINDTYGRKIKEYVI